MNSFGANYIDFGDRYWDSAERLTVSAPVSRNGSGLLSTILSPMNSLLDRLADLRSDDRTRMYSLGSHLTGAAVSYRDYDRDSADEIDRAEGVGVPGSGGTGREAPFQGFEMRDLPAISKPVYRVRQHVESAMNLLSPYDSGLAAAIGMSPCKDYLEHIAGDWEILQPFGEQIGSLGLHAHSAAHNIGLGNRWATGNWDGTGSDSFVAAADTFRQHIADRGSDLTRAGKITTGGGEILRRLARNQAAGLVNDLLAPKTFLGLTLPLGHWAQLSNRPLPGYAKSEIDSDIESLRSGAESRKNQMESVAGTIVDTLRRAPGRSTPDASGDMWRPPDEQNAAAARLRYGFGGNKWWETNLDFLAE